ncbi:MAG: hypothetical protein K9H25_17425 [Rhodospirillum sp.]|nr:hypothetical protein [Rhodospirillum sp.]MCF8490782.1 hypothetical protein [Rhodospirillum sp.]MCF8499843.1 hypothetical protein [Rhodospirillum sp.]
MRVPDAALGAYLEFLENNLARWSATPSPVSDGNGAILIDLFHNDYHYNLRALLVAKYIQTLRGGRLIALIGTGGWMIPPDYNIQRTRELAVSFQVDSIEVIDFSEFSDAAGLSEEDLWLLKHVLRMGKDTESYLINALERDGLALGKHLVGHYIRFHPKTRPDPLALANTFALTHRLHDHLKALMTRHGAAHVITGHPTFLPYGLLVDLGVRAGATVHLFGFQLNDLSLYSITPEMAAPALKKTGLANAALKDIDQELFDTIIWPKHAALREDARRTFNLATDLSLQKPWWWDRDGVGVDDEESHRAVTTKIQDRRQGRTVVCLFAQLVLESLHLDEFLFDSPLQWMEETLKVAMVDTTRLWVFKPHPLSQKYGDLPIVEDLARRFSADHIIHLPYNLNGAHIENLCDVGLTVCGTIGYLLPATGVPVLHAGHTTYTKLGFSNVPASREAYFAALANLECLTLTEELRERARLYYLYRKSLTHLVSGFLGPYRQFYGAHDMEHIIFWKDMTRRIKAYTLADDSVFRNLARGEVAGLHRLVNLEYLDYVSRLNPVGA